MKDKNESTNKVNLDRRTVIKNSAALIGAGLIGSFVKDNSNHDAANESGIFNVRTFGATGKRDDKATVSVQQAIDACTAAGGGTVFVPAGEYTVGTVQLKNNVTLHLDVGSTLFLSQDDDDFIPGSRSMIFAENAENIAVTGRGTLDGLAEYDFTEMRTIDVEITEEMRIAREAGIDMRRYYRASMQTFMFVLNDCTNILLKDITVLHSPLWNIRFNDCDRIFIRGIYVYSDLEKGVNADGIDICSSSNVTISDSVIITADDAIVLKTPSRRGRENVNPVENIVVTNCILSSSSTPLQIGTETFADIRHVIFSNCTIRNSNKGFGINVQDGATVSDILFTNLTIETNRRHWNWWGSAEMCKFILRKRDNSSKLGKIENVVINNIIAHTRGTATIKGHPDQPLGNFRLENVQIFMNPEDAKDKRCTNALEIENVSGLKIRDLSVDWTEDSVEEKWQSALVLKNISDLELRYFTGRQGLKESDKPAIVLDNISEALIAESRATAGCSTFLQLSGSESRDLVLRNNNVKKAKKLISYGDKNLQKVVELE